MKKILSILIVVSFVLAEELIPTDEEMAELRSFCMEQHYLSSDEITDIQNYHSLNEERVRNYFLCIGNGISFYNVYSERIIEFKKKMLKDSSNLAKRCLDLHFNNDDTADEFTSDFEDCVKSGAVEDYT